MTVDADGMNDGRIPSIRWNPPIIPSFRLFSVLFVQASRDVACRHAVFLGVPFLVQVCIVLLDVHAGIIERLELLIGIERVLQYSGRYRLSYNPAACVVAEPYLVTIACRRCGVGAHVQTVVALLNGTV